MQVLVISPFYHGSHEQWLDNLCRLSKHDVTTLTLKGRNWKWRMHGAAVKLSNEFLAQKRDYDLIVSCSLMDTSVFISLSRHKLQQTPVAIYFHESQFSYPMSRFDTDLSHRRDLHYGFINIVSLLAADHVFFNSVFHREDFFAKAIEQMKRMPDEPIVKDLIMAKEKTSVLPLGLDLKFFDRFFTPKKPRSPTILWNHRWEEDKNPEEFFNLIRALKQKGKKFKLHILGQQGKRSHCAFDLAKVEFKEEILHWGHVQDRQQYARLLWESDISLVTSNHDFFGQSVVEAAYCGVHLLLPKRLAYPEHFREEEFFYHDTAEALQKLCQLVDYPSRLKACRQVDLLRYDWQTLIKVYDKEFEILVAKHY